MSRRLILFGLGTYAELAHFYFGEAGRSVDAFTVDAGFVTAPTFCGLPVLAWPEAVRAFPPSTHDVFVAIGYAQRNRLRQAKIGQVRQAGYRLANCLHPSACVASNAQMGDNLFVRERAAVGPFVTLGDGVVLGVQVGLSHHVRVGDCAWLSAGAVLCGNVEVGEAGFIGANATVRDGIVIGAGCLIGAGALVLRACEPGSSVRGLSAQRRGAIVAAGADEGGSM